MVTVDKSISTPPTTSESASQAPAQERRKAEVSEVKFCNDFLLVWRCIMLYVFVTTWISYVTVVM